MYTTSERSYKVTVSAYLMITDFTAGGHSCKECRSHIQASKISSLTTSIPSLPS